MWKGMWANTMAHDQVGKQACKREVAILQAYLSEKTNVASKEIRRLVHVVGLRLERRKERRGGLFWRRKYEVIGCRKSKLSSNIILRLKLSCIIC